MAGERNLGVMLTGLEPGLDRVEYVFATVPAGEPVPAIEAAVRVDEAQGTTLVLGRALAVEHGLRFEFPCRRITLGVHSDLQAVGLTAAVSSALAAEGLPANVVAGFHHDHLFVPADRAELARDVLLDLTRPPDLRPATPDDEPHLWAMLRHASWADDHETIETDEYLRVYVEDWGRPTDVGVVATGRSGRVVGAAWARPLADDVPELAVGVVPSLRGRGAGGRMLERLFALLAELEVPRVRLDVRPTNPAIRLYERLDFERTGTTTNRLGETSIVMERTIP